MQAVQTTSISKRHIFHPKTIRGRAALTLLLATVLLVIGILAITYFVQRSNLQQQLKQKSQVPHNLFTVQLQQDAEGLGKALAGIVRDEEALKLFVERDKEALYARTLPLFEEIKENYLITHLYFIQPSGEVFLRVHNKDKAGDVLQRITYLQARDSGEPSSGIEMGKLFFSLRAVRPVKLDGEFIGYVEAGQEIDHISQYVKQLTGSDVSLWLKNDFIEKKGTAIEGQQVGDFTLLSSTASPEVVAALEQAGLPALLDEGLNGNMFTNLGMNGVQMGISISPFQDAGGDVVGVLMATEDNTAAYRGLTSQVAYVLGLGLLIYLGLILILYLSTRRSFNLLARISQSIQTTATTGRLEAPPRNQTDDEVGRLAGNFCDMIEHLQKTATSADQVAKGDLTVQVVPLSEEDQLGNAFGGMVVSLRNLVGRVAHTIDDVNGIADQFYVAADQTSQAAAQVAATIHQVAIGTGHQAERVSKASDTVTQVSRAIDGVARGAQEQADAVGRSSRIAAQISEVIEQVATNARAGAQGSTEASDAARSGAETIGETITGMESIKTKVGQLAQRVREMGQRSDQIGAIVETIDDIASQTNLLALNAAIEAARAGEHGKGFAVVADEVRKLAEKSAEATQKISGLISGIQQTVSEAVTAMDEGMVEVENGVVRANEAGQALGNILSASEQVNYQVAEIAAAAHQMTSSAGGMVSAMDTVSAVVEENTAATQQMAASSGEVIEAIEGIFTISEENSAAIQEVSAATQELNAQTEEVTASAHTLSEMAQRLQLMVNQFSFLVDETSLVVKIGETPQIPAAVPARLVQS